MFNYISNGLVEKMVDDLGSIFFSPNIITEKSIEISNGLIEKMMDDLGSNFFPKYHYWESYWNFHMRIK